MTAAAAELRLSEWESATPDSHPALLGRVLTPEARPVADLLNDRGLLRVTELRAGLAVAANSRVGRVRLGDLQISVRPKLPFPALLPLVRYAHGLRALKLVGDADHPAGPAALEDLFAAQLLAEAEELLFRGLARSYRTRSERLAAPRGRILVNRLAAGLRLAADAAADLDLRRGCRRLAAALEEFAVPSRLTQATLAVAEAGLNRLTATYRPAMTIVRLLLEARGASLDASPADRTTLPGFLFDMNAFFQALLCRFLRENLPGVVLRDERTLPGALRYVPGYSRPGRKPPRLRPDFLLTRDGRTVAVLDAKYRDLWGNGLPPGMLYQLAVYSLAHPALRHATILYPAAAPGSREERIEVVDPVGGGASSRVGLRPVDLGRLAHLVAAEGADNASRTARIEYATLLTGLL